jgi:hypothetical protein
MAAAPGLRTARRPSRALAGLAFAALVPLLIVYDAVGPTVDPTDFAADLIDRFDLTGLATRSVRPRPRPPATSHRATTY